MYRTIVRHCIASQHKIKWKLLRSSRRGCNKRELTREGFQSGRDSFENLGLCSSLRAVNLTAEAISLAKWYTFAKYCVTRQDVSRFTCASIYSTKCKTTLPPRCKLRPLKLVDNSWTDRAPPFEQWANLHRCWITALEKGGWKDIPVEELRQLCYVRSEHLRSNARCEAIRLIDWFTIKCNAIQVRLTYEPQCAVSID